VLFFFVFCSYQVSGAANICLGLVFFLLLSRVLELGFSVSLSIPDCGVGVCNFEMVVLGVHIFFATAHLWRRQITRCRDVDYVQMGGRRWK
jgi:hypothetical protein